MAIFFTYFGLRIHSLITHSMTTADLAFDTLSLGSCILFPRLVFFLINNPVVVLAVRGLYVCSN
jgi:hypothetical protein